MVVVKETTDDGVATRPHAVRDPLGRAYSWTSRLAEREKILQQWADYLHGLKHGAKVVPINRDAG